MNYFRTKFWSAAADFLNKAGDLKIGIISVERIETGNGAGIEQSRDQRKRARSVCLWEDRALAGFMPLKSSLSTLDSFSLPQFKRLSSKVLNFQRVVCLLLGNRSPLPLSPGAPYLFLSVPGSIFFTGPLGPGRGSGGPPAPDVVSVVL